MLTLTFRQSKSKNYKEAIQHARFLGKPEVVDGFNVLHLPLRNIIEKWEWFNLLFWIILDWKGTTVKYNDIEYFSHTDKTRIFYAVQQVHTNWINFTTERMVTSFRKETPETKLLDKDPYKMSNEEVDRLIEVMLEKKRIVREYEEMMEGIEKMVKGVVKQTSNLI